MAEVQIERGVNTIRAVVESNGVRHIIVLLPSGKCLDNPIHPADVRNAIQNWNTSK